MKVSTATLLQKWSPIFNLLCLLNLRTAFTLSPRESLFSLATRSRFSRKEWKTVKARLRISPLPSRRRLTIMATATLAQYQAVQKRGPLVVASIRKPTPGPNEVSIRLKAIALNPLDWRMLCFGAMIESWPAVLGVEVLVSLKLLGRALTIPRRETKCSVSSGMIPGQLPSRKLQLCQRYSLRRGREI